MARTNHKVSCRSQRVCEAGGRIVAPGVSPGIEPILIFEPSKRAAEILYYAPTSGINNNHATVCHPFGARHDFYAWYPGLTPGATFCRPLRGLFVAVLLTLFFAMSVKVPAQINASSAPTPNAPPAPSRNTTQNPTLSRYLDQVNGLTASDAAAYALAHNGELEAARKELDVDGTRQINGKDNSVMANAMLPLELGGRRSSRVAVAEREVEVREREVANRERTLSAEVRVKFGEGMAQAVKLSFTDELVEANQQSFNLVAVRVMEGAAPPLEQNMALVELNRLRSIRESAEGKLEVLMLELRNLIGLKPEEPLRLRGNFTNLIDQLPPLADATERALHERPDLQAFHAAENR